MSREKIAELKSNIEAINQQLNRLEEDFKVESAKFLRDFWEEGSKRILTNEPAELSKLSDDSLRELKKDIELLESETEGLVESALSEEDLWYHKKKPSYRGQIGGLTGYSPPEEFDHALRLIVGTLQETFAKHGISSQKSFDFTPKGLDRARKVIVDVRFSGNLKWSEPMLKIMNEYEQTILKLVKARDNLGFETSQTERTEAENRWDSF